MSDWRNLEEIMQDLSVAQGYVVPADLETFTGDGPPAYNVEEDSIEQSFYAPEGGGSGLIPAPNYKLIQKMLNVVKEANQDDTTADSSDLDPTDTLHTQKKEMAEEAELSARRPMPKDVIPSMFKRKSSHPMSENVSSLPLMSPSPDKLKQYTPSAHATAYYSKFLEKSQLEERLEEDLWARAERQMKELEEKKKRRAELVTPKERGNDSSGDASAVFAAFDVALPEHRHLQPGDCVVCIVAAKHDFYF